MGESLLLRFYEFFNGQPVAIEQLIDYRQKVERYIDSIGTGPYVPKLSAIKNTVTTAIKKLQAKGITDIEKLELVNDPKPVEKSLSAPPPAAFAAMAERGTLWPSKRKDPTNKMPDKKAMVVVKEVEKIVEKTPSNVVALDLPISQIHTDTKRFQNRQGAFSEASAQSVAENYDPNKFDPIVVWKDPKAKKLFVLSGHSRLEGMKRRKSKTIAVRYFKGSEDKAIQFAKVEANRAANQENLIEDLAAYKLMRDGDSKRKISKATKGELSKIFKGKAAKLESYSFLSERGLFVEALNQSSTSNYPYIERNAQWVGILRMQYPVISNQGEDNIFHFFYSDKSGKNIKLSKDEFFALAKKKINQLRKGESVLFPECSSEGCKQTVDKESDAQKGEGYKRLREINEQLESITEKLTSKDATIRVTTDQEKKYLRDLGEKLNVEKERILRDFDLLDKSQNSLFGVDSLKELKEINKLKEKRNKLKKGSTQRPSIQNQIEKLEKEYEAKYKTGLFAKKYPELYGLETENLETEKSLGFTDSGQGKIYDLITDRVLQTMKKDGLFWRTKWDSGKVPLAKSYPAAKEYRGANWVMLTLMANMNFGYSSPFFMTFNALKKEGGTLKKKAESWPVVYYNRIYIYEGKKISKEQYDAMPESQQDFVVIRPFLQYYNVFNAQNIEGIDFPETKYQNKIKYIIEFERLETAEEIVNSMPNRPDIDHGNRTAHYLPSTDKIDMPDKRAFDNAQDYYSVLFHELIHSTGHKSRLNRVMTGNKDSKEYAFEELVAELGASYLCAQAGILYHTINDSAVYLKHYSAQLEKILKEDNKFFLKAAAAAQKAADFILDKVAEPVAVSGPQIDAFNIEPKKKKRSPLNELQMAQLQDAIKAGRTPKVNLKAKMNATKKPAPLFDEPVNNPRQASLFGQIKNQKSKIKNLSGIDYAYTPIPLGPYQKDFERLFSDSIVGIYGLPGHGKTTYELILANYLATQGKKVLFIAREEYGRSVFDIKLKEHNIGHPNLTFNKQLEAHELKAADVVFLDSVNALKLDAEGVEKIYHQYPNKLWFLVLQSTKDGNFKGSQEWEHVVDVFGEIQNRKLILRKNRLDPNNSAKAAELQKTNAITEAKKKAEVKEAVKTAMNKAKPVPPATGNQQPVIPIAA